MKEGERVGALVSTNSATKTVEMLGYGTYNGRQTGGPLGDIPNPKITLDSGEVVWGCECWWGPEEEIKQKVEGWESQGWTIKQYQFQ